MTHQFHRLPCEKPLANHTLRPTYRRYLSHVDGERLCPAIKQLEEKKALVCWDFIRVIDDEDVVRSCAQHPGHAVVRQEGAQVVISNPAVLSTAIREVVEEDVHNLVTYVVVCTIEEKPQETVENAEAI